MEENKVEDVINFAQSKYFIINFTMAKNDTLYLIERGKKVIPCNYSKNAIENIKKQFSRDRKSRMF